MGKQRGDCWLQGRARDLHAKMRGRQQRHLLGEFCQGQDRAALNIAIKVRGQVLQARAVALTPRRHGCVFANG